MRRSDKGKKRIFGIWSAIAILTILGSVFSSGMTVAGGGAATANNSANLTNNATYAAEDMPLKKKRASQTPAFQT